MEQTECPICHRVGCWTENKGGTMTCKCGHEIQTPSLFGAICSKDKAMQKRLNDKATAGETIRLI